MTHRFKVDVSDCRDKWHARSILLPYVKKYGVKVTFRKTAFYVHLSDKNAYSTILSFLERGLYNGKVTATPTALRWLRQFWS